MVVSGIAVMVVPWWHAQLEEALVLLPVVGGGPVAGLHGNAQDDEGRRQEPWRTTVGPWGGGLLPALEEMATAAREVRR